MARWLWVVATLAVVGCKGGDGADGDDATDDGTDDGNNNNNTGLLHNGAEVPNRDPDFTYSADLNEGEEIDITWANTGIACWPGNENVNFDGAHVFFDEQQPETKHAWVRAVPYKNSLDISLYAMQIEPSNTNWPPNIASATTCEASYDQSGDHNPGYTEAVFLSGWNDYRIVIGVAGANGAIEGGVDVEFWFEDR